MFRKSFPVISKQLKLTFRDVKPKRFTSKCVDHPRIQPALLEAHLPAAVLPSRTFAKGRNIKKTTKNPKTHIYEHELSEFFDVEKLYVDLNKPIEIFKNELAHHTNLKLSQGALENLKVSYEGKKYTLQDLAEITKKNDKMFVLIMDSFPQMVPTVVDVLQKSDLQVQQEGERIYIPIRGITKEHREVLVRKSKMFFFKCKESIRDVQLKYMKSFKNEKSLSAETRFRITNQLVALKDKHVTIAENIFKEKEAELLRTD